MFMNKEHLNAKIIVTDRYNGPNRRSKRRRWYADERSLKEQYRTPVTCLVIAGFAVLFVGACGVASATVFYE